MFGITTRPIRERPPDHRGHRPRQTVPIPGLGAALLPRRCGTLKRGRGQPAPAMGVEAEKYHRRLEEMNVSGCRVFHPLQIDEASSRLPQLEKSRTVFPPNSSSSASTNHRDHRRTTARFTLSRRFDFVRGRSEESYMMNDLHALDVVLVVEFGNDVRPENAVFGQTRKNSLRFARSEHVACAAESQCGPGAPFVLR